MKASLVLMGFIRSEGLVDISGSIKGFENCFLGGFKNSF